MSTNTILKIFGSSHNNFGSDSADLDMCIWHPDFDDSRSSHSNTNGNDNAGVKEERNSVIQAIGEFLRDKMGMQEVQIRSTARIPIVLFRDPHSGNILYDSV